MIEGFIFDLDGTILDSMDAWDTLGSDYLRSLGYTPREDIDQVFRSFTVEEAAEYYIREYRVPFTREQLTDGVNHAVAKIYRSTAPARPGILKFLSNLQKAGVRMAVATATDKALTEAALSRLHLESFFQTIVTCSEAGAGKTDPRIYRIALQRLGTRKSRTMVAEDALHAAATAAADGFPVLGVAEPHEPDQEKLKSISRVYLPDFLHTDSFWTVADSL